MPVSSHNLDDRKPMTVGAYIWRTVLVLSTVTIVLCSSVGFWYFQTRSKHLAELNEIIEEIRAQHGPLTGPEIDAYYAIPDGEEDLTAEYLAAISVFELRPLTSKQSQLPFVGITNQVPNVGEEWELLPVAEEYLQRFQPQLNAFRELADRQGRVRYAIKFDVGREATIGHTNLIRLASRHLELQFWVCMHRGDRTGALAAIVAMFRLGETLRDEPMLDSQMARCGVHGIGSELVAHLLRDAMASQNELEILGSTLSSIDFKTSLLLAVTGERAMIYTLLRTKDSQDLDHWEVRKTPKCIGDQTLMESYPGDSADLLMMVNEMVVAASCPFHESLDKFAEIDNRVAFRLEVERDFLPWNRHVLASVVVPTQKGAAYMIGRAICRQECLQSALAIEHFRLKYHKYPHNLSELVPEFMPNVLSDPFVRDSLRYRLDESNYTIYSVGIDKLDQGGDIDFSANRLLDVGVRINFKSDHHE